MEAPPLPSLTNMECVVLIVLALACVVPCAIQAWLSARTQTRLSTENRTLIAAVLSLSEKPVAALLARQIEGTTEKQIEVENERKVHPVPSKRPMAGAS